MEVGTFWQHQELLDILFLMMALSLLLLLPLLGLFSTFTNFLFTEKKSSQRAEDFALLLGRFMAPKIFSLIVVVLNAILGASLLFSILLKYSYFSWGISSLEACLIIGLLASYIFIVISWRRVNFRIWSALFMSKQERLLLLRDYGLLAYLRALTQFILFSLIFLPLDKELILSLFLIGAICFVIFRLFVSIKILSINIKNSFSIFLYLCTAEFLPWAYMFLSVEFMHKHNYLVSLFEYL